MTSSSLNLIATGKLTFATIKSILTRLMGSLIHLEHEFERSPARYEISKILETIFTKYKLSVSEIEELLKVVDGKDAEVKKLHFIVLKELSYDERRLTEFLDVVSWRKESLVDVLQSKLLTLDQELGLLIQASTRKSEDKDELQFLSPVEKESQLRRVSKDRDKEIVDLFYSIVDTRDISFSQVVSFIERMPETSWIKWKVLGANRQAIDYRVCCWSFWEKVSKESFLDTLHSLEDSEKRGFVITALEAFKNQKVSFVFTNKEFEFITSVSYVKGKYTMFMLAAYHHLDHESLKAVKNQMIYRSSEENLLAMKKIMASLNFSDIDKLDVLEKLKRYNVVCGDQVICAYLENKKAEPQEIYNTIEKYSWLGTYVLQTENHEYEKLIKALA